MYKLSKVWTEKLLQNYFIKFHLFYAFQDPINSHQNCKLLVSFIEQQRLIAKCNSLLDPEDSIDLTYTINQAEDSVDLKCTVSNIFPEPEVKLL